MLLPFIQMLACLSLINGGLYALHLTGGGSSGGSAVASGSNANSNNNNNNHNSNNLLLGGQQAHSSHPPGGGSEGGVLGAQQQPLLHQRPHAAFGGRADRSQELADKAQLDRERMMLELAMQTAAAGGAATGRRGRPIVTGRIQMRPAEDPDEDEFGSSSSAAAASRLLQQAAENFMFGSVVKQPARFGADDGAEAEYEDSGEAFGGPAPRRYEYGRVVQPAAELPEAPQHPHPHHQQQQQQHPFDARRYHDLDAFDAFELDAEPDVEDDALPDLDGYQYLDELLAEQQQQLLHDGGWHHLPQQQQQQQQQQPQFYHHSGGRNPFHGFEELEAHPAQTLQELFGHPHEEGARGGVATPRNRQPVDPRLQQKWQRKRAQQQQKFLGHKKLQQHLGLQQQQQARQGNNKMTLASVLKAEAAAVATKQQQPQPQQQQQQQQQHSSATSSSKQAEQTPATSAGSAADATSKAAPDSAASAAANAADNNNNNKLSQQQQQQNVLHPNHKRSGIGAGATGGSSSGYTPVHPPPPVTHSIANQLMLRTARGQRQYDVPQIECPTAIDGMERFACPTPDVQGRYRCIDDHVLCDGFIDCPEGEDEDRRSCMFYKTTKAHLDVLADALLRWARGR